VIWSKKVFWGLRAPVLLWYQVPVAVHPADVAVSIYNRFGLKK